MAPVFASLLCCGGANIPAAQSPAPQPVVTTIKITPSSATLQVGATQDFAAQAFDQNGVAMTSVTFAWSSSDNAVSVSSTGAATAENVGSATINAASNGIVGQASFSVAPAAPELSTVVVSPNNVTIRVNQVATFAATALDQNGVVIQSPVNFTWTSSTNGVVTPNSIQDNAATGFSQVQFTGAGANQTTVISATATFSGKSASGTGGVSVVF